MIDTLILAGVFVSFLAIGKRHDKNIVVLPRKR